MKKLNINMIEDLKSIYLMPALEELKKERKKKKTKIDQPIEELITELNQWITALTSCFQKGPGQQHEDQSYTIDVNDGVLVNAAPLWPLLDQHWEEPKKVWKALVNPRIKDYDWSKVAMRYFKERVIKKCQADISLAYSHQLHDIS